MLSFKTPWKRSPQNHAEPVRLKEKGLRGRSLCWLRAGRHLWKPQPPQDAMVWARHKPHISLPGRVSARDVFIQQSKKAQSRGRYKPKKNLYLRGVTAVLTPSSSLNTNLEDDKTSKELPSNLFLILLHFCKPPTAEY